MGWVVGGDVAVGGDGEAGVCVYDGGGFVDVYVVFEVSDGDGAGADGEWIDGVGVEVGVFVLGWELVADEECGEFVAEFVHRLLPFLLCLVAVAGVAPAANCWGWLVRDLSQPCVFTRATADSVNMRKDTCACGALGVSSRDYSRKAGRFNTLRCFVCQGVVGVG